MVDWLHLDSPWSCSAKEFSFTAKAYSLEGLSCMCCVKLSPLRHVSSSVDEAQLGTSKQQRTIDRPFRFPPTSESLPLSDDLFHCLTWCFCPKTSTREPLLSPPTVLFSSGRSYCIPATPSIGMHHRRMARSRAVRLTRGTCSVFRCVQNRPFCEGLEGKRGA